MCFMPYVITYMYHLSLPPLVVRGAHDCASCHHLVIDFSRLVVVLFLDFFLHGYNSRETKMTVLKNMALCITTMYHLHVSSLCITSMYHLSLPPPPLFLGVGSRRDPPRHTRRLDASGLPKRLRGHQSTDSDRYRCAVEHAEGE